jgi:hypothetical protein
MENPLELAFGKRNSKGFFLVQILSSHGLVKLVKLAALGVACAAL